MISLVLPTYAPNRAERERFLYDMLKNESGIEVEVVVVCENKDIYDKLKYDQLIKLPKRIGFTKAVNIAEKFCTFGTCWWIDDYVVPERDWGPKAYEAFYEKFPDGMGIMEISKYQTDCPKSISTRSFMYSLNGGNFLWNEYIHCGDTETWYKATALNKFYSYPEMLWHRDKIEDESRKQSLKQYTFDIPLREERMKNGWPNTLTPDYQDRMYRWAYDSKDENMIQLYKNIFNI
jgi:hypothetical protein